MADLYYQYGGRIFCVTGWDAVGTPPNKVRMDLRNMGLPLGFKKAEGTWRPPFPHFVDKENELAKYWKNVITPHKNYPNGMSEAGYVLIDNERRVLLFWTNAPTPFNLNGGSQRPDPIQILDGALEMYTKYREFPWNAPTAMKLVLG